MTKVDIAGLKIDALTKAELLDVLKNRIMSGQKTWLTTVYSEFLRAALLDPEVMRMLNTADIAVPDGIGMFWAARYLSIPLTAKSYWGKILQAAWQIKYTLAAIIFYPRWIKSVMPEKISGADLVWDLAKMATDNNLSVYLLGGFGDTSAIAAKRLEEYCKKTYNLQLTTYNSPKNPDDPTIINDIKTAAPDLLFVAYGPIKQERWIATNLPNLPVYPVKSGEAGSPEAKFNGVKLAVGLGGTFDYLAGKQPQPPQFLRRTGLEWLWRLFTQPKRYKRIINATFGLCSCLWHYKVFANLPLRKNVVIVILNQNNNVLVCQRDPKNFHVDIITTKENLKRTNYWQLPQGGIDGKESLLHAAQREALEETGLKNLELIKISPRTNTYIWNNALRKFWHNRRHRNIGQIQNIAYLKFSGADDEVKVDHTEFINFRWVSINELNKIIHPERANLIKIAIEDLKDLA